MHCLFVTPELDGPVTGGTLFNQQLLAAVAGLSLQALSFEHCSWERLPEPLRADQVWVDSLYLRQLPTLRRRLPVGASLQLLLHYLPSLLTEPAGAQLSEEEAGALAAVDAVLTPSPFLQRVVERLCPGKLCRSVEPGVRAEPLGGAAERGGPALMIANVTENKGVLALLQELAGCWSHFRLEIAGSLQLEAAYARRCHALCEQDDWLREHVRLLGSVPPEQLSVRLASASVLVSASRMESYGMALAEARALGAPILALAGGNIAAHVAAESGGELLRDTRALADALCALMDNPIELRARQVQARASARARSWAEAAQDFVALALAIQAR
jgi:glycosyltransferase involved in cell wall biosynthesis